MKRCLTLVLLLFAVPAEAKFRTVSEWESMPPELRTVYVAGVRDFVAVYASRGKSPVAARIHTCLGSARFAPAATADFIFEWVKLRKDVAKANAAGFVFSYIKNDCTSPSADYAKPAKPVVPFKEFAVLPPPLQASYVEAIQDTLESFSDLGGNGVSKLRECITHSGLIEVKQLANAVTKYAQQNERWIESDASFAEVAILYLVARCK